jgi:hypothetical protein
MLMACDRKGIIYVSSWTVDTEDTSWLGLPIPHSRSGNWELVPFDNWPANNSKDGPLYARSRLIAMDDEGRWIWPPDLKRLLTCQKLRNRGISHHVIHFIRPKP